MGYAFNAYQATALGCAAIAFSIIVRYLITLRTFRRRATAIRAVERLQNLPRGEPLEPLPVVSPEVSLLAGAEIQPNLECAEQLEAQPAAGTEASPTVGAEVEPILDRAEPLYSDSSQTNRGSIVQQDTFDALIVDQQTNAVTHGLSEVQPAVSTEAPPQVNAKVQPILKRAESQIQPGVSTEVPLSVSAKVRPILKRAKPLEVQPSARPELPLPVGSEVWAVCKFGSVAEGTPGIITGVADGRYFWQSPAYLCTFADNRKVRARPKDVEVYNHGHSLEELEQPDLKSILSRRMTLRAQRQRPTNLHFAGGTELSNEIAEINTEA